MNIITIINGKKTKKEKVVYIEKHLKDLDLEVMKVFILKEVETVEQHIYISLFNKMSSLALHED